VLTKSREAVTRAFVELIIVPVRVTSQVSWRARSRDEPPHQRRVKIISTSTRNNSKADIAVASYFYFFPPLIYVLQENYKDMWTIKSELHKTLAFKKSIRSYLAFRACSTYHNPNTVFAIVEYKKPGLVRYENISNAILEKDATNQEIALTISSITN